MAKATLSKKTTFFPMPAALVVSGHASEINIITIAWIGIVSATPPSVGISVRKSRHSYDLIQKTGEFTVNIPSASQMKETDYCGIVSGRDHHKFEDTSFTAVLGKQIQTPLIDECPLNMECKVTHQTEVGSHVHIIGEILETHIDEDKLIDGKEVNVMAADPLVFCSGVREYWSVGKKLGDGFKVGRGVRRK